MLDKLYKEGLYQKKIDIRLPNKNLQKCFVLEVPALFGQIRTIAYHSW